MTVVFRNVLDKTKRFHFRSLYIKPNVFTKVFRSLDINQSLDTH